MARNVTLLELRTQARQRANMENSQFITDSELNSYINNSCTELYDLLIAKYEDYHATTANIPIVVGTDSYALPTDFYKLLGVDLVVDAQGNAVTLKPFMFAERNAYRFTPTWNVVGLAYLRYHMIDSNIRFVPVPNSPQTVKLWYIPALTKLSADADVLDGVSGWEEYVIVDAAIKMISKEEGATDALMIQKEALKKRIEMMAANRDPGSASRVSDTTKRLPWEFWSFGEGT